MDAASLILAKAIIGSSRGGGGAVQDVQVNGTSILQDGVANVPVASNGVVGLVRPSTTYGTNVYGVNNTLGIVLAELSQIKSGGAAYNAIPSSRAHYAAFYGLAKAAGSDEKNSTLPVGQYTDAAKSAISQMLNGSVSVTGSTPTITALPGVQYECGEVSTLDITLPNSGIVDVTFASGSTPTVLTITAPTGMTVEWANGFDSTALDADTIYEINFKMVGAKCLGVAGSWT